MTDMTDLEFQLMKPKIVAYAFGINPEPWAIGSLSIGRNKSSGKLIPTVAPDSNLKVYQQAIISEFAREGVEMKLPYYSLRFTFSRQLVSYTTASGRTAHRNWSDVTNMQKATEDALQGVILGNDRDVIHTESQLASPQTPETKPWVLVEMMYGIEDFMKSRFPDEITDQGITALAIMQKRAKEGDRVQGNTWSPSD